MIKYLSGVIAYLFLTFLHLPDVSGQQVTWNEEPAVRQTLKKYQDNLKQRQKVQGWRVQFFSTTDRRSMENTLRQLKTNYPDIRFTWVYKEPLYQIRAGAFLYRKDAAPLQHILKKEFAGAFPVQDEIEILELLENN
jgi:hypothetical protein